MNIKSSSMNPPVSEEESAEELDEMVEITIDLQTFCIENLSQRPPQDMVRFFSKCLQASYNQEIITEESLLKWFKSPGSKQQPSASLINKNHEPEDQNARLKLREIGGKFLQLLMDADEESDSET